jgi:glycerate kinase
VDVENRLMGAHGATQIYGPQKGIRPEDVKPAERCFRRLVRLVKQQSHFSFPPEHRRGAGAAGGLGFGLFCFATGRLEPGFRLFARLSGLMDHIRRADLVITGEGAIDRSTLMGKGVGQIAQRCRELNIPCIGLAGVVGPGKETTEAFARVHALTDLTTVRQANIQPAHWLERLAWQAARRQT